jgi:hypothetical protein
MVRNPDHAIWLPVIFAALFGITVTLLWMRLLRRSPRLRHSLHVSGEGIPHTAELIHELKGEESPPEEDGVAGTQAGSPGA